MEIEMLTVVGVGVLMAVIGYFHGRYTTEKEWDARISDLLKDALFKGIKLGIETYPETKDLTDQELFTSIKFIPDES